MNHTNRKPPAMKTAAPLHIRLATVLLWLAIAAAFLLIPVGCVSTAPRAGGDAASRSNGNIAITVNQHGPARDGTAEFNGKPVTGAVNIIIASNQTSQDAAKAVDALKVAANAAVTGQGTANAEGEPSVTTPPAPATDPAPPASEPDASVAPAPQPVEPNTP